MIDSVVKQLETGDLDKVRDFMRNNCQEDEVKEEITRKVVNSRCNALVVKLLKVLSVFQI